MPKRIAVLIKIISWGIILGTPIGFGALAIICEDFILWKLCLMTLWPAVILVLFYLYKRHRRRKSKCL
jgi:purine-cytosine permease-like protein